MTNADTMFSLVKLALSSRRCDSSHQRCQELIVVARDSKAFNGVVTVANLLGVSSGTERTERLPVLRADDDCSATASATVAKRWLAALHSLQIRSALPESNVQS